MLKISEYVDIKDEIRKECAKVINYRVEDIDENVGEWLDQDESFELALKDIRRQQFEHIMRIVTPRKEEHIQILPKEECMQLYRIYKHGCIKMYQERQSSKVMKLIESQEEDGRKEKMEIIETIRASDHLFLETGIEKDQL